MPRFRALVVYNGSPFRGWQIQPNVRSVEGELTNALQTLSRVRNKFQGASRTDAGVHAVGQVAHFDYDGRMSARQLLLGLNSVSDHAVQVLHVEETADDFNARFHARGKRYRYDLWIGRPHHPLYQWCTGQVKGAIDLELMERAAGHFLGEHDFSCLRASGCSAKSPILRIGRIAFVGAPPVVRVIVEGNAFLKYMVRTLVGTLVDVGRGRRPPDSIPDLIASRDRTRAGNTAPAQGLRLVHVRYPETPWADGSVFKSADPEGFGE